MGRDRRGEGVSRVDAGSRAPGSTCKGPEAEASWGGGRMSREVVRLGGLRVVRG